MRRRLPNGRVVAEGIYVETFVRAQPSRLLDATQIPELHRRWDLRFSDIEYVPREPGTDQRFLYATRVGFGLTIRGFGETTGGVAQADGTHVSGLRFWSDDPRSLIRTGSGYWRYVPCDGGMRFLTYYDYRTRFGAPGELLDRTLFRPLLGWATAWSFDALRLWLERGIEPERGRRDALVRTGLFAAACAAGALAAARRGSGRSLLLTLGAAALAAGAALAMPDDDIPSARRCKRSAGET